MTMMRGELQTHQSVEFLTPDKLKKLQTRTPPTVACTPSSTDLARSKRNGHKYALSQSSSDDLPIRIVGQQESYDSDFSNEELCSASTRQNGISMSLVAPPYSPKFHQRTNTRSNPLDFAHSSSMSSFVNELPSNTTRQRQSYLRRNDCPVNGNSLPKSDISPSSRNLDTTKMNHPSHNRILQSSSSESQSPDRVPYSPSKSKSSSYFKKGTLLGYFNMSSSNHSHASIDLPYTINKKYKRNSLLKPLSIWHRIGKIKLLPTRLAFLCMIMGCILFTLKKSDQKQNIYSTDIKPHDYSKTTKVEDAKVIKDKKYSPKALNRLSTVSKIKHGNLLKGENRIFDYMKGVILPSKNVPSNSTPFHALFNRATSDKINTANDNFIYRTEDKEKTGAHSDSSHHRLIHLGQQKSSHYELPPTRTITQFPAEFSDNTQFYSVYSSDDEKLSGMEIKEPFESEECVAMKEWQTTFNPSCNGMHELDLVRIEDSDSNGSLKLVGKKGYWRNAWSVDILGVNHKLDDRERVILKTLRYNHDFEDAHFEHDRVDAVAMERLTSSPNVIDIYGFCGHSVITEHADPTTLGSLADKSRKKPLKRLEIARDIASGLADVHGMDGDGNATFVHLDINPANVIVIGTKLKLNDFNIGILRRWNKTSNTICGFPAQYPNPQWRSPEEANESQHLTEKVDIFSMGHIFFRLICGHEPWNKLELNGKPSKTEMTNKVKAGILPRIPDEVMNSKDPEVSAIREAMLSCYRFNPKERPSAREIAKELNRIHSKLQIELNISKKESEKRMSSRNDKNKVLKIKKNGRLQDDRKNGLKMMKSNEIKGFLLAKNKKTPK